MTDFVPTISPAQMQNAFGESAMTLIHAISRFAQTEAVPLYIVGGAVRDLFMGRKTRDIDFVVEAQDGIDAIRFAEMLCAHFGGTVHTHRPFGTAIWQLDRHAVELSGIGDGAPRATDFATSRTEDYPYPAALPTVHPASIEVDLARRDFTINTLALQLSPSERFGSVLYRFGAMSDLDARIIRVLHPLSFIDDPTRILRAARFAVRLDFTLDPDTEAFIAPALPILAQVTGERLRNELALMLGETDTARGLRLLERWGALRAIHSAFALSSTLESQIDITRAFQPSSLGIEADIAERLLWLILSTGIARNNVIGWAERLLFPKSMIDAMIDLARILQTGILNSDVPLSQIATVLRGADDPILAALFVLSAPNGQNAITRWMLTARHLRPATDGEALRSRGLAPGPCYRVILDRLRDAWIDDEIADADGETCLLNTLIEEGICNDHP